MGRTAVDDYTPDGEPELPPDITDRWEADPEHLWVYGGHPALSPKRRKQLKQMLMQEKGAFVYNLADLPGYSGELGEVVIQMKDGRPIWTPDGALAPQGSKLGMRRSQRCSKLTSFSSSAQWGPCMPAGSPCQLKRRLMAWSDKRLCIDLRGHNSNNKS